MHGGVTITQCPDPMSHVLYHHGFTKVHGTIQYVFKGKLVQIIVSE